MPRVVVLQRALGLGLAVALAVLAVFAFRRPAPEAAPQPRPAATSPSAVQSLPTDTSTDGSGAVSATGPGLTEPGIRLVAQPDANGAVEVLERVKLSTPVKALALAPPQAADSGVPGVNPTVTGFQAQADGQVVASTPAPTMTSGGQRIELSTSATEIAMRYRVDGAVGRSQPAPVGRALIVVAPLTADATLRDLPVVVEVVGNGVRNLVCPKLAANDQLCGRQAGRVWFTPSIPLSSALVVAQVDLPQPGVQ